MLVSILSYGQGTANNDSMSMVRRPVRDSIVKTTKIYNKDTIVTLQHIPIYDTVVKKQEIITKDTLVKVPAKVNTDILAKKEPSHTDTVATTQKKPIKAIAANKAQKVPQPDAEQYLENKELFGKWQMESTEMADGYYYTYSFVKGNTFIFGNDENEGLNRIISLTGTYYLRRDTLIIYVKQENDLVGGTPEMTEKLAGSGWAIKGGKIVLKDLPVVKEYYLPIKPCPEKDNKRCIEINSMSYYKLE